MITGPNMSINQSLTNSFTYSVSQIGSFVPAEEMTFGLDDHIY